ncbi:MAG: hypothetical protein E7523_12190 [Ruminococcaceae bacterium]|nr:hypothetical protein [Oscillospiraceae bacterium]
MKKIISILLCALILVSALSLTAFAETERGLVSFGNEDGSSFVYEFSKTEPEWTGDTDYIIRSGCTFVVPTNRVLNVPYTSSLTVEEGAHLVVNGQLNAVDEVHIYGKLTGDNVTGQENIKCYVQFPDLTDANINLGDKIDICYYLSESNDSYGDVGVDIEKYLPISDDGINTVNHTRYLPVLYNTYLYVRVKIQEEGTQDKYDDKLFPVKCNGVVVKFDQNACPILVTTGSEISYGSWVNDATYYNTYTISLPEGTGYTVYGRNGEIGEVTLKYGQAFSFRVELEQDYDKSAYQVYVFNGTGWTDLEKAELLDGIAPAVPDSEGYFTITNITGNHSVFVEGVLQNKMLDIFEQIFTIFRQIWEAITEIFNELFGEGGLNGLFGQA